MNVGVYFDLRNPPDRGTDFSRLYGFALEMCEEAEHLGAHSVWVTEHHLFDDGYLTQPLGFLAAVAARTRRVRLGTAIIIAPLHNPVEIAEQAALVDILSGGRLDLGLGAGYRIPEYELYGAPMTGRYAATDHRAREARRLFDSGGLTPPPVQRPLPVWMGYQGPQGARRAGLLGAGLLSANANLWPDYRGGLTAGGHDPARGRMAGGVQGFVSDDPERDWPVVAKDLAYQVDSYRRHMVAGTGRPTPRPVDAEQLRARDLRTDPLGGFSFGTPEQVADDIRALTADAPVETVFLWASIGGASEEMTARHVQTICARLRPLLEKP
jgi:alkanesulfonate monooxygenase SsuD/methylene tetrahydromethanopterin reductase-like flavin-dependent oxidoreductase (luciferase family)